MNADKFKDYRSILSQHQNMDNITPMQDLNFCRAMRDLETKLLSDRDQFAIGFAEWIQLNGWEHYPSDMIWIKNQDYMNGKETTELLDLYKQSLTKTDKK